MLTNNENRLCAQTKTPLPREAAFEEGKEGRFKRIAGEPAIRESV